MTLEEIVKLEGRQPDCSGYVTKYDIKCSDGLTIRPGAFSDDDGRKVPLVYMHDHENIDNILGHMYLEAKDDGVYGLGYFNSSPKGQLAKLYVDHGDISSFSIYANKLKKKAKDVVHGMIREVSLVLAGANRGAVIDSPIAHSDDDNDEFDGVICMGDDYGGPIYGNDEPLSSEEYLEHYGNELKEIKKMIEEPKTEDLKHKDPEESSEKTVKDVFDGMNDDQKAVVYYMIAKVKQNLEHSDEDSEEEEDEMKHNVFDDAKETKEETLSHDDMVKLETETFRDAKTKGSLRDAFLAHAEEYGIDNIEFLFPEDRNVTNTPTLIKRPDGWVSKVMKAVGHSPFSRIKSLFADITEPDARARGYIKGNKKVEEVFGLLKRVTIPTTVYKKQKLDRDDIVDITDFDVVTWLKAEMRGMLDEELARAYLIGDGRSPASNDKINEQNIRPIYSDDDLFVIRKAIAVTSSTTTDAKCKEFIRACIKARKDYRGSGNPTLYTTEDMLTDMLLMEDNIGHALYDSVEKLATKLRVKEIVTVPVFENQSRTVGSATMDLLGIIVNLSDYKVGADKGGSVNMFEDFDIDYNQEKYLIETRCSGALTVPYSAIVIESSSSVYLEVDPDDPTETRYSKGVADLQSDVVVNDDSIGGVLKYVTGYTGYSEDTALQSGNYLSIAIDAPNGATTTVKMVNNGGVNETETTLENDYYVAYVRSKNAKIVVTTTLAGVSVTKTYSLRLLKLEKA